MHIDCSEHISVCHIYLLYYVIAVITHGKMSSYLNANALAVMVEYGLTHWGTLTSYRHHYY